MDGQSDAEPNNDLITDGSNSLATSSSTYKFICHPTHRFQESRYRDQKRLIAVSVVCLLFMTAEIAGGIISNSLAIATDAAHLMTDFGAFMVSLISIWIASKPRTSTMLFGFHRAEVIGALISVLSIWLITGIIVYMAVERLIYSTYKLDALIMIYVSASGIAANLVMGLILVCYKGGNHAEKEKDSINVRSAVIHILGDMVQSVGVFVASLIIYFYPHLKVIDPVCSFVFSIIVLITTYFIIKDIFIVLMQGSPRYLDFEEVKNVLYSIEGVQKVHNIRMWSLTMDKAALSAHLVVGQGEKHSEILKNAVRIIGENFDIYELTLQIEEAEASIETCTVCT